MGILDRHGLDPGPDPNHGDEKDDRLTDRASDRVAGEIIRRLRVALGPVIRPELEQRLRRVHASAATARIGPPNAKMVLLDVTADSVECQVRELFALLTDEELRLLVNALAEP